MSKVRAITWSKKTEQANWIVRNLHDDYTVAMLLPPSFDAYARLLHPIAADTVTGRLFIRWKEVATVLGGTIHPRVQFDTLAPGQKDDYVPAQGSLPIEDARVLVDTLAPFTPQTEPCWFGVWFGYADMMTVTQRPVPPPSVHGVLDREYILYSGMIDSALALIEFGWNQTPNLWWPANHAWCVATEIDLDSTYIGGSKALIRALLANPNLEAVPVKIDDRITANSDDIN